MKKFIPILLLTVAFPISSFSQNKKWDKEPDGFNGIILGKTFEENEIKKCEPNINILNIGNLDSRCYISAGKYYYVGSFPFDFAKEGVLSVDDLGRISAIQLQFKKDNFEELLLILNERYGKPTSIEIDDVGNNAGAKFKNTTAAWVGEKIKITAFKMLGRVDTSVLSITLNSSSNEAAQRRVEKSKSTASKL